MGIVIFADHRPIAGDKLDRMVELYDLKTDPSELKNLIHQSGAAKTLAVMKREMERLLKRHTPQRILT